jgi:hypothetical protein
MGSQMAVRLPALRAGRRNTPPSPQEDSEYSFLLEAESTPGVMVRLEGVGELKNPVISSGIEPATSRIVAECLYKLCYLVFPAL